MNNKKICGIYCIECKIDGKKYIGLSRDIYERWKQHKKELKCNRHINRHLQFAWNKYGEENFSFYILEECVSEILGEREIYYIQKYDSLNQSAGYNLTSGGDGTNDVPIECRMPSIIEQSMPVIKFSLEGEYLCEYLNCGQAANDVNGTDELIRRCCHKMDHCKTHKGYIWMYKKDYEQNGLCLSDYVHQTNSKTVVQYDLQMNYIAEYKSAREAEQVTGIGFKMISRVCNGQRPCTHGYIFKFKN